MNRLSGCVVFTIALIAAPILLGCHTWVAIKPSELPRLNGSTEQVVSRSANSRVVAITTTPVERPDGRLVEIRGNYDVRIESGGRSQEVGSPVLAELEGDHLIVRGSNMPRSRIPLSNIDNLEVSQFQRARTVLLTTGIAMVGAAIVTAVVLTQIGR